MSPTGSFLTRSLDILTDAVCSQLFSFSRFPSTQYFPHFRHQAWHTNTPNHCFIYPPIRPVCCVPIGLTCLANESVERGSSAVERRTFNRESLSSNPLCCHFVVWTFSFSPWCPSSINCINEYLPTDIGWNIWVNSICALIATWLNAFQRSRVGIGMNKTGRTGYCTT